MKAKIQELQRLKTEPWGPIMETWRLKWGPGEWRVCRPVIDDSDHFDEEQDPDPHLSDKSDPH